MSNTLLVADPPARTEHAVPPGVTLRQLREDDLRVVGEAYWRTYVGSPDEMTLAEATDDVFAAWNGEYDPLLAAGSLGAWQDDELVGAILTVVDAPWPDVPRGAFIIDLFVLPDSRRRGIGRALVQAVQDRLQTRIGLRVADSATEARSLYATLGFRVLDE